MPFPQWTTSPQRRAPCAASGTWSSSAADVPFASVLWSAPGSTFDTWSVDVTNATKHASCHATTPRGEDLVTGQFGPFVSHGGYDWWTVEWVQHLVRHDAMLLVAYAFRSVDATGVELSNPPLHYHHLHINPSHLGARKAAGDCVVDDECFELYGRMSTVHGDFVCVDGRPCYSADLRTAGGRDGYGWLVRGNVSVNAQVNDVRPHGAPPLEWLFTYALLTDPNVSRHRHLSTQKVQSTYNVFGGSMVFTPDRDVYFYYTFRFLHDGLLVNVDFHSHQESFVENLVFNASVTTLGLSTDASYTHAWNASFLRLLTVAHSPLCRAEARRAFVGGAWYDRRAHQRCIRAPLRVSSSWTLTSVSMHHRVEGVGARADVHDTWWFYYTADDNASHCSITYGQFSQEIWARVRTLYHDRVDGYLAAYFAHVRGASPFHLSTDDVDTIRARVDGVRRAAASARTHETAAAGLVLAGLAIAGVVVAGLMIAVAARRAAPTTWRLRALL